MKERVEYFDNIRIKSNKKKKFNDKKSEFKDVNFKKSLGQNFISDKALLNDIVGIAEINNDDYVLEIGAGAGTLTEVLAKNAKQVLSYEIDKSLELRLNKIENRYSNLSIVFEDFMTVDENKIFEDKKKYKVVANIPYYITTPIIFKLMNVSDKIESMLFMVQKEVAVRFASIEGSKDYGIPSIILQSIADVSVEKIVPKEWFTPAPNVDSALMKIMLKKDKFKINDFEYFSKLVHTAFSMRRKTLINNLCKLNFVNKEKLINNLKILNFNENIRPEEISVKNYVKLANLLKNN